MGPSCVCLYETGRSKTLYHESPFRREGRGEKGYIQREGKEGGIRKGGEPPTPVFVQMHVVGRNNDHSLTFSAVVAALAMY